MHGRRVENGMSPDRIMAMLVLAILVADCSAPLTIREKCSLASEAIGAGTGPVIGSTAGHPGTGALQSADLGVVNGDLLGDAMPTHEQKQVAPLQRPVEMPAPLSSAAGDLETRKPQTLHAREIKAGEVRANTIYANEIKARDVYGRVYQTNAMETQGWYGKIDASVISASIIYAKRIQANSVTAQTIYVHKLDIR